MSFQNSFPKEKINSRVNNDLLLFVTDKKNCQEAEIISSNTIIPWLLTAQLLHVFEIINSAYNEKQKYTKYIGVFSYPANNAV